MAAVLRSVALCLRRPEARKGLSARLDIVTVRPVLCRGDDVCFYEGVGGATFAPQLRSHSSHLHGVQRGLCVDSFMLWIYLCLLL